MARRRRTRARRAVDLPYEMLGEVLRRVPPRHLAACRRVCKDWRAVIDGRGLVLAHLAPRPLRGIFVNFFATSIPSFFSRRSAPITDSRFRFLPEWWMTHSSRVLDHSNGLVLYEDNNAMYVCNPVTRRWATVPPPPSVDINIMYRRRVYLVSDPTLSLHYHVLYIPDVPEAAIYNKHEAVLTEWPPHSYTAHVFSSATGQWEERNFIREVDPLLTLSDVWSDRCEPTLIMTWSGLRCYAVYLQGVIYLHCYGGFLIRLSLLEDRYAAIETPRVNAFLTQTDTYGKDITPFAHLRKSEQGVYYTVVCGFRLAVWVLHEEEAPAGTLEYSWELKHQADLELSFRRHYNRYLRGDIGKSWILVDPLRRDKEEEPNTDGGGWDSGDEDSVIDVGTGGVNEDDSSTTTYQGMDLLGYHPCKEIVFLGSHYIGFAYYLGSSKLESLGSLRPNGGSYYLAYRPTLESFIYTPCMDDLLPAAHHA